MRALLKCHCGNLLTGAASRGKGGKYFYYYKCRYSGHNNISAIKAHDQFDRALDLMSLSPSKIAKIRTNTKSEIEKEFEINRIRLAEKKTELSREKELLYSVEDKYIKNEIDPDTYKRWYATYRDKIDVLDFAIMRLEKTDNEAFSILDKRLELVGDVKYIYRKSDTLEKREFLDLVFDSNLYYQNGIYRTPTMIETLSHNQLKMKDLGLLIVEKKGRIFQFPLQVHL